MNKLFISVLITFVVTSVLLTVWSVTTGAEVSVLESKKYALNEERKELEAQLVKAISLGDLEEKSLSLGLTKPTDIIYLTRHADVAIKN